MAMPVRFEVRRHRRARHDAFRRTALSLAIGAMAGISAGGQAAQPGQILSPGTLPQVRGVTFGPNTAVRAPTVDPQTGAPTLTVTQQNDPTRSADQRSIIEWNSFNVARGSVVNFVQPNAGASVLNKIYDLDPSIIQGSIKANGQIILLNQNGILFDGGSQVNARSLIASTLDIDNNVFLKGVQAPLDPAALQFSGVAGYTRVEVAASGPASATPATLTADPGGNIIILAPNVVNNGIIRAPDGQVILAAGKSVLLFQPSDQNSAQMRGFFVQVTADKGPVNLSSLWAAVTNNGTISADRGNVTLAGIAVNQMGRITAKTAVNQNGSIWLIAQDKATLGASSVTETPLDTTDTTRLSDAQDYTQFRASVKVTGNTIVDSGQIVSPSGSVIMSTTQLDAFQGDAVHNSLVSVTGNTANSGPTRIFLDAASVIDTSGNWADVALSSNLINVKITSNDLKDDPAQKGGILLGQTVTVDVRKGTPLFDISGYAGAIQRTVAEKATMGGNISLLSQGDVIVNQGALLDVSGGGLRYAGGTVNTTKLLSGGRIYDIGSAPADQIYGGVISGVYQRVSTKWGITQTYGTLLGQVAPYEAGYVQGSSAGALIVDGASIVLGGTMRAGVVAGPYQTAKADMPSAGALTIGIFNAATNRYLINSITFVDRVASLAKGFDPMTGVLSPDVAGALTLSAGDIFKASTNLPDRIVQDGFGSLTLGANGRIDVPAGIAIQVPAGGSITMTGGEIAVSGSIVAPGGSITLTAKGTLLTSTNRLDIAPGARLSTAGLWVNDRATAGTGVSPPLFEHAIDGGTITLASDHALDIEAGSLVDVSGGANRSAAGAITAGKGGSIKLVGGSIASGAFAGTLSVEGTLSGYSAGTGAILDITAANILIGGTSTDPQTFVLSPAFFQQGGFQSYKLTGAVSNVLADNTTIVLNAENYLIDPNGAVTLPSGSNLQSIARKTKLPDFQRSPTNLTLAVNAGQPGRLLSLGAGSSIQADPGAAITLTSNAGLEILGQISAPAGSISIAQVADANASPLHIGSGADLSVAGIFVGQRNQYGLMQGQVRDAGTISLTGGKGGDVVIDANSKLDVSGARETVYVANTTGTGPAYAGVDVNSNSGLISIASRGGVELQGDLQGQATGSAAGGSFALSLSGGNDPTLPARRVVVSQDGSAAAGTGTIDANVSVDKLNAGGFDKLRLSSSDVILFGGDTTMSARRSVELDAPVLDVNRHQVKVAADQVRLYGPSTATTSALTLVNHLTTAGSGSLNVVAGVIDLVGGITINGAGTVGLASTGDIRVTGIPVQLDRATAVAGEPDGLAGYLVTPADINLSAKQVYPTTLSQFRFSVANVTQTASGLVEAPVAGGHINVARADGVPDAVLSAGGKLTFAADNIAILGTVKAPLGQIDYEGGSSVILDAKSISSVSAAGLVVPFGETVNGQNWNYLGIPNVTIPTKQVIVNASSVTLKSGAVLDVSGGGDVQAVEWVPGIGGSRDVLLSANTYAILPFMRLAYAPYDADLRSKNNLPANTDGGVYNAVYFAGGGGIAAGYYPLLPGYYALLPGAYKVTLQTGSAFANMQAGQTARLADGTTIIAGKLGVSGTGVQASTWSAFSVESLPRIQKEAEYRLSNASFFASQAINDGAALPPLPVDAGRVSVSAANALSFAPTLLGTPAAGGNIAQIDISASDITVVAGVGNGSVASGVQLDAGSLSALNASLLLGGTRANSGNGTTLNVGASTVTIQEGATLRSPEIILAATGTVDIQGGANGAVTGGAAVSGEGSFSGTASNLAVTGTSGALLRVSSGNQIAITRNSQIDKTNGTLVVGQGARVAASKSMMLDATGSTQSGGVLAIADGGFLTLGASQINIGNAPASAPGLQVGNAQLATFEHLDTIALRSYGAIGFYGDVTLGSNAFNRIALDAASLSGDGGTVNVIAHNVTLQNGGSTRIASSIANGSSNAGALNISARQVTLGAGSKAINGFGSVTIGAQGDITGSGTGDLRVAGNLTLESARVTGGLKSDQAITALDENSGTYFKVSLQRPVAPLAASGTDALGAKFAITAASIDDAGVIALPAGTITLTATGADGIALHGGAIVSAAGAGRPAANSSVNAAAGKIIFVTAGALTADAGSIIDLSGSSTGGDAGTLAITSSGASAPIQLDGTMNAFAQSGYRQGSAILDLATGGNFSALNAKLNQGGFSESRNIRIRTGDVTIAGADPFTQRPGDIVVARNFVLSVDQGSITVAGTIDASGAAGGGGSIELDASGDIRLVGGSAVLARGTSAAMVAKAGDPDPNPYSNGGSVEVSSRTGKLTMETGAIVDVSANPNGKSSGGKVIFSASRTANAQGTDADVNMDLAGIVKVGGGVRGQAGSITIEGVHVYTGITDTSAASDPGSVAMSDYQSFVGNATAILARLGGQGLSTDIGAVTDVAHVSGGVELQSSGNMVLSSAWDLTTADWMPLATSPGRLTLRAAGNLVLGSTLGFPDDNLALGPSWSIRLAGGADLGAANAMAVQASAASGASGDVVFQNNSTFRYQTKSATQQVGFWNDAAAKVRTGTGTIRIAAGRDVVFQAATTRTTFQNQTISIDARNMLSAPQAVAYTAGMPVLDGAPDSLYPTGGGDISVSAGRNIVGAAGQPQYVNDWLRRTSAGSPSDATPESGWWAARVAFRDNVGALGGGNVRVSAVGNISDFSAAVPSSGRTYTDDKGVLQIDVTNGGNLDVVAGGNLNGGEFLVGRGVGRIAVAGAVGTTTMPALYLMGQSSDLALEGASFSVVAGGNLRVQNVSNPTILVSSTVPWVEDGTPGFDKYRSSFFTYDPLSAATLVSVAGDLVLPGLQRGIASKSAGSPVINSQYSDVLPPNFSAIALQGNISGNHVQPNADPTYLYPTATSRLVIYAGTSISNIAYAAADFDPATQPHWAWNSTFNATTLETGFGDTLPFKSTLVARLVTPQPDDAYSFVIKATDGSITDSRLVFPRKSWIEASVDLRDVRMDLQNLSAGDVSVVKAGRDVRYVPQFLSGIVDADNNGGYINVGGPGRLLIEAGRNIDLGTSAGITATGNNSNSSLPTSASAALTVVAGVQGDLPFDTIDELFSELKDAGIARKAAQGDAAIAKAFAGATVGQGDITMFFSAIRTQGGSGIDLLAPGGNINAGLPTPGGGNIGIYTTFGGAIRSYLSGDFNINQSKVMTLDGGDILLYSSNGNIDAGRGARDSVTTQKPQRVAVLDDKGNPTGLFNYIPPSDASGSGIRTLTFDPDGPGPLPTPKPGDIFLFAPKGFIDAGEAGVSSAGNIFVAALQVLNANNFSAAGSSVGVPVAVNAGVSASVAGASNVGASASKSAEDATRQLTASAAGVPREVYRPSFISVELLGMGDDTTR